MSSLPRYNQNAGEKKKNIWLSIKPTKEKEFYRFRLLAFNGIGTDRSYPFIERFIHTKWGKDENGRPKVESTVVCPVTKWAKWEGDRYDCPICRAANQYFITYKESGWKDRDSNKRAKELGRKFEAIIPVYVIDDPTYPGNNGKFKVIVINDKKVYKEFVNKVTVASQSNCVFNGGEAVDCVMHMTQVPKIVNEGQPNQYTYNEKVFDKIIFSTKPHAIAAITKEAIDAFPFDEQYYQSSTLEEIQEFYNKYVKVSYDDIPEDDEAPVFTQPKVEKKPEQKKVVPVSNSVKSDPVNTDVYIDADELLNDIDIPDTKDEPKKNKDEDADDTSDDNINDLLEELKID